MTVSKFYPAIAIDIARKGHEGQMYGDKDYFTYHVTGVINSAVAIVIQSNKSLIETPQGVTHPIFAAVMATAALHDWLEDCEYKDDHDAGIKHLLDSGIPQFVTDAVLLLTKSDSTIIEEYLDNITENWLALVVKRADMGFNIHNNILGGSSKRFKKYAKQMQILLETPLTIPESLPI